MGIATLDELLHASDITETHEVELPSLGLSVKIRPLPAAYSNVIQSEASEVITRPNDKGRLEQVISVDHVKEEAMKVLHGVVEPRFASLHEVNAFSQNVSSGAWDKLISEIDRVSALGGEAAKKVEATFRSGGRSEERPSGKDEPAAGDGRSDVPVRAGVGVEDDRGGAGSADVGARANGDLADVLQGS